jgi:putative PIN family toxin of toxin-antitoxin system
MIGDRIWRVVFDTNIVVSAIFGDGPPRRAVALGKTEQIILLASDALLSELQSVLARPKFSQFFEAIGKTPALAYAEYRASVQLITPAQIPPVIIADPKDDPVIACAVGGNADYIVSGDRHLLGLGQYRSIPVWDAARFLASREQS